MVALLSLPQLNVLGFAFIAEKNTHDISEYLRLTAIDIIVCFFFRPPAVVVCASAARTQHTCALCCARLLFGTQPCRNRLITPQERINLTTESIRSPPRVPNEARATEPALTTPNPPKPAPAQTAAAAAPLPFRVHPPPPPPVREERCARKRL